MHYRTHMGERPGMSWRGERGTCSWRIAGRSLLSARKILKVPYSCRRAGLLGDTYCLAPSWMALPGLEDNSVVRTCNLFLRPWVFGASLARC